MSQYQGTLLSSDPRDWGTSLGVTCHDFSVTFQEPMTNFLRLSADVLHEVFNYDRKRPYAVGEQ